jgi:hypothetical protein
MKLITGLALVSHAAILSFALGFSILFLIAYVNGGILLVNDKTLQNDNNKRV